MIEFLGAAPEERTAGRNGYYRAGCYSRYLITRIGELELGARAIATRTSPRPCSNATPGARKP